MIKRKIRRTLGPVLQQAAGFSGLMRISSLLNKPGGAVILMYHSTANDETARYIDPDNHVPPEIFKRQMEFLSKKRNVLPLSELVRMLSENKTPPEKSVAITFDDGYMDNLTVAAPVMSALGLPATIYLATGYVERGETQWIDQLYTIFRFRTGQELVLNGKEFYLGDERDRKEAYAWASQLLLESEKENRTEILSKLRKQLEPAEEAQGLTMKWNDVRRLLKEHPLFSLGAHTEEHLDLSRLSAEAAAAELEKCRKSILRETGINTEDLSFCYGRTSAELRETAGKLGFRSACGGEDLDKVIKGGNSPFMLPRIAAPRSMNGFALLTDSDNTGIWRKLGRRI